MNSGSFEAFHVVVVCQDTPPSRRIRRSVSRLIATTMPSASRWSRSLANDQVEKPVRPQSAGEVRAIGVSVHAATDWSRRSGMTTRILALRVRPANRHIAVDGRGPQAADLPADTPLRVLVPHTDH